jgi:hypothetical protein
VPRDVYIQEEDTGTLGVRPAHYKEVIEERRHISNESVSEKAAIQQSFQATLASASDAAGRPYFARDEAGKRKVIVRSTSDHFKRFLKKDNRK